MGAQEKSSTANNSMQRVKVYRLNDDGKWDDQGTGHVTVDYLERSEELGLFVIDEEDNETLLLHRISSDDIYRKQEDTIISWRDPEYSTELALSFQETTGCSYIWDRICSAQRNLH
uniref:Putative serine/threonine-protein phosphatase 4 regulatory subunit 3 isoform X3 n=1 Tax=Davidia involucrata TaxID=16924 RepID=A0A5B7BDU1_DAVIN